MVPRKPLIAMVSLLIFLGGCAALRYRMFNRPELLFSHEKHLKEEIECDACHGKVKESEIALDDNLPKERDCLECHDRGESPEECAFCHREPRSPATLIARVSDLSFSHKRHYDEGIECEICHKTRDSDLSIPNWSECSECHEISHDNCDFCHTKLGGRELMPASHDAFWVPEHRLRAVQNEGLCETCHRKSLEEKGLCESCHRGDIAREFIHDVNYIQLHPIGVKLKSKSCGTCHGDEFCSSCHDKLGTSFFEIHGKGWVLDKGSPNFHGKSARRNLESCVSCHDETSCLGCHSVISPHPEGYKSRISSKIAIQHRDPTVCLKCHEREDLCSRCHAYEE
jgi:hypothetical protein